MIVSECCSKTAIVNGGKNIEIIKKYETSAKFYNTIISNQQQV